MTIPSLTLPPDTPQRSDPATFPAKADAYVSWQADTNAPEMVATVTAINTTVATMSAIAAGGAMTLPYTFSSTTTDADPGAGFVRLSSATQNASTVIRLDLVGADGSTWTDVISTFDDSTSTVKGYILLQKLTDATKWLEFSVSSLASPAGYKNLTVVPVASSAASPFADGDSLVLKFTATGDKGDTGATGTGGAVVWIKCDAAGGIQASTNVTSITDNGPGDVTVTIATDFTSADYAVLATVYGNGFFSASVAAQAAGSVQVKNWTTSGGSNQVGDPTYYYIACFGTLV